MRFGWVMAVGVAIGLNAASVSAGGVTTTTSSSTSTSTTTLLGGCVVEQSYESILCRIDALIAQVDAAGDLGRLKNGIRTAAQKARKQALKAAGFLTGKRASTQLKKAAKSLDSFRHKLDSNNAHNIIPETTRNLFRDEATPIRTDINALRSTV